MPLTDFQTAVVRLLSASRTEDSYLAGGAAIHLEPRSSRYSNDLDYFHDSEERVARALHDDRTLLEEAGFAVEIVMSQPGFVRALISKDGNTTKIDWAHDSAWRFVPTIKDPLAGYVLHPVDLAINKTLALAGRDEPRDLSDVLETDRDMLSLGACCWAAAGKDPGFTPVGLLSLLQRRGRFHPADFERLLLTAPPDLVDLKARWIRALSDAREFVDSRPPEEVGCLYYLPEQERFASTSEEAARGLVHFGGPGGVLPRVA